MPPLIQGLAEPAHAVVTGASSGVGLALVTQLLAHPKIASVSAIARSAEKCLALQSLHAEYGDRLLRCAMDITDAASRAQGAAHIASRTPTLHVLIHAAGCLHGPGIRPEKSLQQLQESALTSLLQVNAFAPILLTQALLPCFRTAPAAVIAAISARVGSIEDNALGGWYSYRASKAALNMLLKTAAIEMARTHPQAVLAALHPGTVDSALSAPFRGGQIGRAPAAAAQDLLAVLDSLQPQNSGGFWAYDGQRLPW